MKRCFSFLLPILFLLLVILSACTVKETAVTDAVPFPTPTISASPSATPSNSVPDSPQMATLSHDLLFYCRWPTKALAP